MRNGPQRRCAYLTTPVAVLVTAMFTGTHGIRRLVVLESSRPGAGDRCGLPRARSPRAGPPLGRPGPRPGGAARVSSVSSWSSSTAGQGTEEDLGTGAEVLLGPHRHRDVLRLVRTILHRRRRRSGAPPRCRTPPERMPVERTVDPCAVVRLEAELDHHLSIAGPTLAHPGHRGRPGGPAPGPGPGTSWSCAASSAARPARAARRAEASWSASSAVPPDCFPVRR